MATTVVFGGGPLERDAVAEALRDVDIGRVIAADSGLESCVAAGLHCDLVVGDMDSVDARILEVAAASGTVVERHEPDKDATDLELALECVMQRPVDGSVLVVGSSRGRLDHLLAIAVVVGSPRYAPLRLDAVLGWSRVVPVHDRRSLSAPAGTTASLLALHGPVAGVRVTGMRWPLSGAVLDAGTLGVSNRFEQHTADFSVQRGVLTVVVPDQREI